MDALVFIGVAAYFASFVYLLALFLRLLIFYVRNRWDFSLDPSGPWQYAADDGSTKTYTPKQKFLILIPLVLVTAPSARLLMVLLRG